MTNMQIACMPIIATEMELVLACQRAVNTDIPYMPKIHTSIPVGNTRSRRCISLRLTAGNFRKCTNCEIIGHYGIISSVG